MCVCTLPFLGFELTCVIGSVSLLVFIEPKVRIELTQTAYETVALPLCYMGNLERMTGNDPASSDWQTDTLPLSYTRMSRGEDGT